MTAFAVAPTVGTVTLNNNLVGVNSEYKINVTTNLALTVAAGDNITVEFPEKTIIPASIDEREVTVDGNAAKAIVVSGQIVTIALNNDLGASTFDIVFKNAAGLTNPSTPGTTYKVKVKTSKETDMQESAAYTIIAAESSRFTSSVSVDKDGQVDASLTDELTFTFYVRDKFYNNVSGQKVYIASNRGMATDTFVGVSGYAFDGNEGANFVSVVVDQNGKGEVKLRSTVSGPAKIAFGLAKTVTEDVYGYLIGRDKNTAEAVGLIKTVDVSFVAQSGSKIQLDSVVVRDRENATNLGGATNINYNASTNTYSATATGANWNKANDLDYFELAVKVTNAVGAPVSNQSVSFNVNKAAARLSATSVNTNSDGIAKVKVFATKGDTYTVTFNTSGATAKEAKLVFAAPGVSSIQLVGDNDRTIAKDSKPKFKFQVYDTAGNIITPSATGSQIYSVDAVKQPDNAGMKKGAFTWGADTNDKTITMQPTNDLTRLGDYTLRVTLSNGKYADLSFTVKEQGTITGLKVSYPQNSVPMNTKVGKPKVIWLDAANVEKEVDNSAFNANGIQFSASNYNRLRTVIDTNDGTFTTTNDRDMVGDVIITATDTVNKLAATFTMSIYKELATLIAEVPDNAQAEEDVSIVIKAVDMDGNIVATGDPAVALVNAYVSSKADVDAIVTIEEGPGFTKGIREKGEGKLSVYSSKEGDVSFVAIISVDDNAGAAKNYTVTFTVPFGEPAPEKPGAPEFGAANVVMFVGSTSHVTDGKPGNMDFAPFIEDGRTFVPVRFLAEGFGVEADWDPKDGAVETVTLTRDDMVITITIGSYIIEVERDGKTETVTSDVAAFIKDGRTVLPFRVIAEAFGAEVDYGPKDGPTEWVSFQQ